MQIKSLRLFLELAHTGSFSLAAMRQNTVQSNVTAHLKKLEQELNTRLVQRDRNIRLTSAGKALLTYAERLITLHDEAVDQFKSSHSPSGNLRIGTMETTLAVRLPPLLSAFHIRYPQVQLLLQSGPTAELVAGVLEGRFDCAFIGGAPQHTGLRQHRIFEERLILVVCAQTPQMPSAQQLQAFPMLAFRQGCSYRQKSELFLSSLGLQGIQCIELNSIEAMLGCVAAGMGFTLLPESAVDIHRDRFHIHTFDLPPEIADVPTYLITLDKLGWAPAMHNFTHLLTTTHQQ